MSAMSTAGGKVLPRGAVLGLVLLSAAGLSVGVVLVVSSLLSGTVHSAAGPAADPLVRRRVDLGSSVDRRPIRAVQLGDPDDPRTTLVVGCIHGDERAGVAIARRLASGPPPDGQQLWIVPVLNPDGASQNTRQNAHGVDLNRNFPWRWRRRGRPGDQQYPGRRPLSESEARIARSLILRVQPRIGIWFHQPLGLVDASGGSIAVTRRFAHLVGLPLRRLTRYPGSAVSWSNHRLAGSTSFVVELPPGALSQPAERRYASAVLRLGM